MKMMMMMMMMMMIFGKKLIKTKIIWNIQMQFFNRVENRKKRLFYKNI